MTTENQVVAEEKVVVTLESLGLKAGERYTIQGRMQGSKEILKDRTVVITGVSKKPGLVQGQLVHLKSGELQKCVITLPVVNVVPYVEPVVEAEATPAEAEVKEAI